MLGGEWPHERRERFKVAQNLGDCIKRRLKTRMACDPLEWVIAHWAACWHSDRVSDTADA